MIYYLESKFIIFLIPTFLVDSLDCIKTACDLKIKPSFKILKLFAFNVAPVLVISEIISDITSTGKTLRVNNLRLLKDGEILKSQACLMISKLSLKKAGTKKIINLLSKYC